MAVSPAVTGPSWREKARAVALRYKLDPDRFERQIWTESRFLPDAVSPKGAVGLGQLMPGTARDLGVDPTDPDANLEGAARYMRQQLDEFGDYPRALAAYNAGPENVRRHGGVPPFKETEEYVTGIMGGERQTVADLGRLVKRKYPAYARIPDADLGRRVRAKYPAYARYADVDSLAPAPADSVAPQAGPVAPRRAIAALRAEPPAPAEAGPGAPAEIVRGFRGGLVGQNVEAVGRTLEAASLFAPPMLLGPMGQPLPIAAPLRRAGAGLRRAGQGQAQAPKVADLGGVRSARELFDYLQFSLGKGLASTVPSVVGAAGGALAGGAVGGPPGAIAGGIAGGVTPSYALNFGDVADEVERAMPDASPVDRAQISAIIALPITALDALPSIRFGGKAAKKILVQKVLAEAAKRGLLARVLKEGAKGMRAEGITEVAQEVAQALMVAGAAKKPVDVDDLISRAVEAGIGGALAGGVIGGGIEAIPQRRGGPPAGPATPPTAAEPGPSITPTLPFPEPGAAPAAPPPDFRPSVTEAAAVRENIQPPPNLTAEKAQAAREASAELGRTIAEIQQGAGRFRFEVPGLEIEDAHVVPRLARMFPGDPSPLRITVVDRSNGRMHSLSFPNMDALREALTKRKRTREEFAADVEREARAPQSIAALERQIAENPNDQRVGQWRNRLERLRGQPPARHPARPKRAPTPTPTPPASTPKAATASPASPVVGKPAQQRLSAAQVDDWARRRLAVLNPSQSDQTDRMVYAEEVRRLDPADREAVIARADELVAAQSPQDRLLGRIPARPAVPAPPAAPAAPAAPAQARAVLDMEFSEEVAARRVAVALARSEPAADPKVIQTKKGWQIEVNEAPAKRAGGAGARWFPAPATIAQLEKIDPALAARAAKGGASREEVQQALAKQPPPEPAPEPEPATRGVAPATSEGQGKGAAPAAAKAIDYDAELSAATAQGPFKEELERLQSSGASEDQLSDFVVRALASRGIAPPSLLAVSRRGGKERVFAGFDPSIIRKLANKLYGSNLGAVMVRELIQNAVDALPLAGPGDISLSYDSATRTFTIKDNGVGMTPATVKKELVDLGGTIKRAEAAGGFGLAKAVLYTNAENILVETVTQTKKGKVGTVLSGSGEAWADKTRGMDVQSGPVPSDVPTGTTTTLQIYKKAPSGEDIELPWHEVQSAMREFATHNRIPLNVTFWFDGRQVEATGSPVPVFEDLATRRVGSAEIRFSATKSETVQGYANVYILNRGMPQFRMTVALGAEVLMPNKIIVDISPSVSTESLEYPFSTSRDALSGEIDREVRGYVMAELFAARAEKYRAGLSSAVNNAPLLRTSRRGLKAIDSSGSLDVALVREIADDPMIGRLADLMAEHNDGLLTVIQLGRGGVDYASDRLEFAGIGLGDGYLGINIGGRFLSGNPAGSADPNIILINPLIIFHEARALETKGIVETKSELAWEVAHQIASTLTHEIVHQKEKGHGESFAGELTRVIGITSRRTVRAATELHQLLSEDNYELLVRLERYHRAASAQWSRENIFARVGDTLARRRRPRRGEGPAQAGEGGRPGREEGLQPGSERAPAPLAGGAEVRGPSRLSGLVGSLRLRHGIKPLPQIAFLADAPEPEPATRGGSAVPERQGGGAALGLAEIEARHIALEQERDAILGVDDRSRSSGKSPKLSKAERGRVDEINAEIERLEALEAELEKATPAQPAPNVFRAPSGRTFIQEFEDLARQGRTLEEATAEAKARSGGEPPAGLDLEARWSRVRREEQGKLGQEDMFGEAALLGSAEEPAAAPAAQREAPPSVSEAAPRAEKPSEPRVVPIEGLWYWKGFQQRDVSRETSAPTQDPGGLVNAAHVKMLSETHGGFDPDEIVRRPILVWRDTAGELGEAGRLYVIDGHHRSYMAKEAGAKRLPAVEVFGDLAYAKSQATLANMASVPNTFSEQSRIARELRERGDSWERLAAQIRVRVERAKAMVDFAHLAPNVRAEFFPSGNESVLTNGTAHGETVGRYARESPDLMTPTKQRQWLQQAVNGESKSPELFKRQVREWHDTHKAAQQEVIQLPGGVRVVKLSMTPAQFAATSSRLTEAVRSQLAQVDKDTASLERVMEMDLGANAQPVQDALKLRLAEAADEGVRLTKAKKKIKAAIHEALLAGMRGERSLDDSFDAIQKQVDAIVGKAGHLPNLTGEEGFVRIPDLIEALVKAFRRLSGLVRRDPVVKQAAKPKRAQRPAVVEKILEALKAARPIRAEQEQMHRTDLARRIQMARDREIGKSGLERHRARRSALGGSFPKPTFESIAKALSEENVRQLVDLIYAHPALDFFEHDNAIDALQKIIGEQGGEVPQPRELALLEIVFGTEFVEALTSLRPQIMGTREKLYAIANISKIMRTAFDLSAPLRQGLYFLASHPGAWGNAFVNMHRYWASEENHRQGMDELHRRDNAKIYRAVHLALSRAGSVDITAQEEAFFGAQLLYKFPGVRRSDRAYSGFLNKLRADVFDSLVELAKANGHLPTLRFIQESPSRTLTDPVAQQAVDRDLAQLKKIAAFVNAGTGRGNSQFIQQHAAGLNALFFSARLIKSRLHLMNPKHYTLEDPFVRSQYLRSTSRLAGAALLVLTLAGWAGARVERERLNSDFGKIRVGGIVYDILGGFVQYARLFPAVYEALWNQATGTRQRRSAAEILWMFTEHKLSPIADFTLNWLRGWKMGGNPLAEALGRQEGGTSEREKFDLPTELAMLFVPMIAEDFFEVMKEDLRQLPASVPAAAYGISVQRYERPRENRRRLGWPKPQPQ